MFVLMENRKSPCCRKKNKVLLLVIYLHERLFMQMIEKLA